MYNNIEINSINYNVLVNTDFCKAVSNIIKYNITLSKCTNIGISANDVNYFFSKNKVNFKLSLLDFSHLLKHNNVYNTKFFVKTQYLYDYCDLDNNFFIKYIILDNTAPMQIALNNRNLIISNYLFNYYKLYTGYAIQNVYSDIKFNTNKYYIVTQKSVTDFCKKINYKNILNYDDFLKFSNYSNTRLLKTNVMLVLPTDIYINIITNSFDVIHSWFIPGLGFKMDCIPGRSTHHTLFIDQPGIYYGQCAEVCGRLHHHMPIRLCAIQFEHFFLW